MHANAKSNGAPCRFCQSRDGGDFLCYLLRRFTPSQVKFVWQNHVILAAIALDLFAFLLGGATALLPIFAKDILRVGPAELGWLQAAPSIGALFMAVTLAHLPYYGRLSDLALPLLSLACPAGSGCPY